MKNGLIRESLRIAREKHKNHPQIHYWPHYSFIVQNNKLIEWAYNHTDTPPIHMGYHKRINWGVPKTHSELAAWRAAKGLLNQNKNFEIINIRLNRKGELRNSQPCVCCYDFLKSMGCNNCIFSIDNGWARLKIV